MNAKGKKSSSRMESTNRHSIKSSKGIKEKKATETEGRLLSRIRSGEVAIWSDDFSENHSSVGTSDYTSSDLESAAQVFAALGNPSRIRLLKKIQGATNPSISELSERSGMTRQAITVHLTVLEQAGLIQKKAEGRERRYGIRKDGFRRSSAMLQSITAQWDENLDRLKINLEQSSEKED